MAKVLAHTILGAGHTYPFLPVLIELQRRGFVATLCVNTPSASAPEQIAGVPVRAIRSHGLQPVRVDRGTTGAEHVSLDSFARSGEPLANAFDQTLAEERPDFLLID